MCAAAPLTRSPVPQDGLRTQNRDVVLDTLSPLTPEVISRQATINIGTIGHVAHGKSTTVKAISGVYVRAPEILDSIAWGDCTHVARVQTIKYKAEKVRNITIKLGYANAKIYKSSAACVAHPPSRNWIADAVVFRDVLAVTFA